MSVSGTPGTKRRRWQCSGNISGLVFRLRLHRGGDVCGLQAGQTRYGCSAVDSHAAATSLRFSASEAGHSCEPAGRPALCCSCSLGAGTCAVNHERSDSRREESPLSIDDAGKTWSLQYGLDPSQRAPILVGIHVGFGMLIVQEHTGYRNVGHTDARANEKPARIRRH